MYLDLINFRSFLLFILFFRRYLCSDSIELVPYILYGCFNFASAKSVDYGTSVPIPRIGVRGPHRCRRVRTRMASIALLRHQNTPDTFVHWLKLAEVGTRNLDRVTGNRKYNNILPGVEFVLVLDHLRSLPIVLNARSLQRELLHLD